jgi:hypothetical protein
MSGRRAPNPGVHHREVDRARGKYVTAIFKTYDADAIAWRGRSWVRSTNATSGWIERMTPFTLPTDGSRSPKSVVRVMIGRPTAYRVPDRSIAPTNRPMSSIP